MYRLVFPRHQLCVCSAQQAKLQHPHLLVGPCINCPDGKSIVGCVLLLPLSLPPSRCRCHSTHTMHLHHAPRTTVFLTGLRTIAFNAFKQCPIIITDAASVIPDTTVIGGRNTTAAFHSCTSLYCYHHVMMIESNSPKYCS